jgi:hypothetical protein
VDRKRLENGVESETLDALTQTQTNADNKTKTEMREIRMQPNRFTAKRVPT